MNCVGLVIGFVTLVLSLICLPWWTLRSPPLMNLFVHSANGLISSSHPMFCPIQLLVVYWIQFSFRDLVAIIRQSGFQAEKYFSFHNILSEHKLSLASFYFDGDALEWYRCLFRNKQLAGWDHFMDKVLICFRSRTRDTYSEFVPIPKQH